jgi:23S rRNA (adenine-N6)-dimethyltransferase
MFNQRRRLYSQNFLYNRSLVTKLLCLSSIGKNDLVLEIGPGKGIITEQLLYSAHQVEVVEIDKEWCTFLQRKFQNVRNFTLHHKDFLDYKLPAVPYKVFANIPFSIEGKIIRKLIDAENPPNDCYLVMMKELAYRLSAFQKENLFSLLHKPWFEFSILYHFKPTDFTPLPDVHSVMLRFKKREKPLVGEMYKQQYQEFIKRGFSEGLPVMRNLKKYYGYKSLARALYKIRANKKVKPSYMSLIQWIKLYKILNKINY